MIDTILNVLLNTPAKIRDAQMEYDTRLLEFQEASSQHIVNILNEDCFPDKSGELRPPTNDKERDAAIKWVLAHDDKLVNLKIACDMAKRELQFHQNCFSAAKAAAKLLENQRR